jgi:hypothetical protein
MSDFGQTREVTVIRKFGRGVLTAAAVVAVAAGGSVALAGSAVAGGHGCCQHDGSAVGWHSEHEAEGGNGGDGGNIYVSCVVEAQVIGGGHDNDPSVCTATGADGGEGGDAEY